MDLYRRLLKDIPSQTPVERRVAPLLQIALIMLMVLTLLITGISILAFGTAALAPGIIIPNGFFVLVTLIALIVLRQGRFKLAWWIVIAAILAVETLSLRVTPLNRAGANLLVFMIPVSIAGLLISRRATLFVLVASIVLIVGDVLLEVSAAPDAVIAAYVAPVTLYVFVAGFVGLLIDLVGVTFRKELARSTEYVAELALLSKRMEVTLSSIGDAVIATDSTGRVTLLNPMAHSLTGWSQNEAAGQELTTIFHIINEYTRQPVENPVHRVLREGVIVGLANHTLLVSREGREIPIDDSGAPIRDGDTSPVEGVVLVFRDVTERKKIEDELFETRERLRLKLESIKDYGIFSLDADKRIKTWNSGAEAVFGYSEADAVGQSVAILYTAEDRAQGAVESEIARALTEGFSLDDRWHMRKDGTRFFGSGTVRTMRDAAGTLHGFVKVVRDVTEREQLAERQAELLQREQIARREAERANALKLQFLAMISHELRTPLTSIKGFVTTLLAEDVVWTPGDQRRYLNIIDEESDRLRRLVEDLLDLSQVQAGVLTINPHPQSFAAIIKMINGQLQSLARSHQLLIALPEDLPDVLADTYRIGQVITNLVTNSARYSPPNTPITIEALTLGDFVQVSVTDRGQGIAPEDREIVFEAFRQAETKRERHLKGAGLGLAICKGLVEAHGGRIWIQSREAPGITVSFTLLTAAQHPVGSKSD